MVERLTVKFRSWRGSELPPRGKTVKLGSSTHVHTWLTRNDELRARRRKREAAFALPLYIDYESDRLVKENSVDWVLKRGTGARKDPSPFPGEGVEDEDKGC